MRFGRPDCPTIMNPTLLAPEEPTAPESSLPARLLNVIADPSEVFEEITPRPVRHSNWVVPAILGILLGWVCSWLIFSQPSIQQQLRDMSAEAIEKQIEKGKMSAQQAEQVRQAAEKFGAIGQKVSAFAAPVFAAFLSPFLWGGILWLFGNKVLKGSFGYMKAVEVVGLSNMIGLLDGIVRTLLIIAMGNVFAAPSLMLLVRPFDPQNTLHSVLAAVSVMTLWILVVRAVGLSRLSGASFGKSALCVFGTWAAYTGFFLGLAVVLRVAFGN